MESVSSFEVVIARLRETLGLRTESEVADKLGLKRNAFFNRKSAKSLPYQEIVSLSVTHDLCLDWIFRGRRPEGQLSAVREVDSELLAAIFAAFRSALWRGEAPYDARLEAARIGHLVGTVYNEVANIQEKELATAAIRQKVREIVHVMRIMESTDVEQVAELWGQAGESEPVIES